MTTFSPPLIDPRPRIDIRLCVCSCKALNVAPLVPSNLPTKLNCNNKYLLIY